MGSAPLPPHERSWRHPSELAASERDALRLTEAPPSARAFAMVTGTIGLLAVGALLLTITPRRSDAPPVAVGASTTTPVIASGLMTPTTVRTQVLAIVRLATPIGDGHKAVMTLTNPDRDVALVSGDEFDVRLTSGPVVTAIVDATTSELALLTIVNEEPGHAVASSIPDPDEIVTVLADPPVTIAYSDIATLSVDEGTPVVDQDGALIGLCTGGNDQTIVVVAVTDPVATTTTSSTSTTTTTSTPTTTTTLGTAPVTVVTVVATSVAP